MTDKGHDTFSWRAASRYSAPAMKRHSNNCEQKHSSTMIKHSDHSLLVQRQVQNLILQVFPWHFFQQIKIKKKIRHIKLRLKCWAINGKVSEKQLRDRHFTPSKQTYLLAERNANIIIITITANITMVYQFSRLSTHLNAVLLEVSEVRNDKFCIAVDNRRLIVVMQVVGAFNMLWAGNVDR